MGDLFCLLNLPEILTQILTQIHAKNGFFRGKTGKNRRGREKNPKQEKVRKP